MKKILLCAAAVATFAAGCATTESSTEAAAERADREYTTGSNIPKRSKASGADGVQVLDREALERARSQLPPSSKGLGTP